MELGILQAEPLEQVAVQSIYPNKPKHPHVTLAWGVPEDKHDVIGLVTSIYFEAVCWSDRIQAIRCQLQVGIPFELQIPHLTISWVDGAKPKESTDMLQRVHNSTALGLLVPCKIKWTPLQYQPVAGALTTDAVQRSREAWRTLALEAIAKHGSVVKAAKELQQPEGTVRSWFLRLHKDHGDRIAYSELTTKNRGGWKKGRARKVAAN